jgi:hypothetical protein
MISLRDKCLVSYKAGISSAKAAFESNFVDGLPENIRDQHYVIQNLLWEHYAMLFQMVDDITDPNDPDTYARPPEPDQEE